MVLGGCSADLTENQMVVVCRHARHASTLASASGGETLDVRTTTWSTADRPSGSSADHSARTRKSTLGLPPYCGRTEGSRRGRVGHHGEEDPASGTARPGGEAAGSNVA